MLDKIKDIVNKKFKFEERINSKNMKYFDGQTWSPVNLNLEDTALAILKIREILGEE